MIDIIKIVLFVAVAYFLMQNKKLKQQQEFNVLLPAEAFAKIMKKQGFNQVVKYNQKGEQTIIDIDLAIKNFFK